MTEDAGRPSAPPLFVFAGVIAPIFYVAAVVIGGLLRPHYSHIIDPIGLLTAEGAPHKLLIGTLFFAFNVLAIFAADALGPFLRATGSRALRLAAALFMANSFLGMFVLAVPMDRPSAALTIAGMGHAALAGLAAAISLATIVLAAAGARAIGAAAYARFARNMAVVVAAFGIAAVIAAGTHQPWAGLAERVAVAAYLWWIARTCWSAVNGTFVPAKDLR